MRTALSLAIGLLMSSAVTAQGPTLEIVVERLIAYTSTYAERFASVLAEERYSQHSGFPDPNPVGGRASRRSASRTITSDYALAQVNGEWVDYRDAFDVDGVKVRDRDDRLARTLSHPASGTMLAILNDNARFNVGNQRIRRNINTPTLVIHFLQPRNRDRFSFTKGGEETIDGRLLWRIDFRERMRPTLVRQVNNQDQPVRGSVWADPTTGEVWHTRLTWEKGPRGAIAVSYGPVPGIDPLVPLRMSESYTGGSMDIRGEASYSNFRQFRTEARLVTPD